MPITVKIIWKPEEDERIIAMRNAGHNNQEIADAVGRPRSTVGHRLTHLLGARTKQEIGAIISAQNRENLFWTKDKDAEIVRLRSEGKSYKAIGEVIGCGHTTVFNRLWKLDGKGKHVPEARVFADEFWTDELFESIAKMRSEGKSLRMIGTIIGRHESTICENLRRRKSEQQSRTPKQHGIGRADFFRRPTGPTPQTPDANPNPLGPAYRKCLGDECGRVFWSSSAAVRICNRCKKDGNEAVRGGTAEYRLML
jgi:DNA-binding CsgD family transcriptional regulator